MAVFKTREESSGAERAPQAFSHGWEWIWRHLANVRRPHVLECGTIRQTSLDVLLARRAKIYVADLITPALENASHFWSKEGKRPVFLTAEFLAQLPPVPPGSLSVITCWGLLDLLPHEALPAVVEHFHSLLQLGGVLFCFLREPSLGSGAEARWWLEAPTMLGSRDGKAVIYPYPAVTNRQMERIFPGGNVKTFLTRTGRREVLGIK